MTTVEQIAADFANRLWHILGDAEFAAMKAKNQTPDYKNGPCCASHDFTDANVPMAEAFEMTLRRAPDMQSDADSILWNQAWKHARKTGQI